MPRETLVIQTSSGKQSFNVEVAVTEQQRVIGLMYRKSLPKNAGMLFIYGKRPQPAFMWMKNTLIPLDMVFITQKGTVRKIEERTEPFSQIPIGSEGEVVAVLELAGGVSDQIGLKVGDKISSPSLDEVTVR